MREGAISLDLLRRLNREHIIVADEEVGLRPDLADAAWALLLAGSTWSFEVSSFRRRGFAVHVPRRRIDRLIEAAANASLVQRLGIKQANREQIVSNIHRLLRDPHSVRIYRLDIKSFYESIERQTLVAALESQWCVTRPSLDILRRIFDEMSLKSERGLPRGLSISATLAEQFMRRFDESVRSRSEVFFYARFVDDILVLTTGNEHQKNFEHDIELGLPAGLKFNPTKRNVLDWNTVGASFEYLGYKFERGPQKSVNDEINVHVDMATSKIRRTKTKLCVALKDYARTRDISLLADRIRFLSGNHVVGRKNKQQALRAGIYYSYCRINQHGEKSALRDLDRFMRRLMFGKKAPISRDASTRLSARERRKILRMSFFAGHHERRMCRFSYARLENVAKCWQHV